MEKYKIRKIWRRPEYGVAGGLVNVWRDLCVNLTDVRIAPQRCRGEGGLAGCEVKPCYLLLISAPAPALN